MRTIQNAVISSRSCLKRTRKLYQDCHAVGISAEGGSRGAGVGNSVGAGFTDVDLRGRDMKLPTRHLTGNKP